MRTGWCIAWASLACPWRAAAEPPPPAPAQAAPEAPANPDGLYDLGKSLFDQYASPELKEQYAFPSKEEFNAFLAQVQTALDSGTLKELAVYEPQAKEVLAVLRTLPEYSGYADWLEARLEEIDEARRIAETPGQPPPSEAGGRTAPAPREGAAPSSIPYYGRWLARERSRPVPANAAKLMPGLREAFAAEGVPPEIAWLAEVESGLNPSARSPSGAYGLFQLKADTARGLGLSTFLPDERGDPEKSAHAAAKMLRELRERFGSWPLAFAAYNAGEGRVGRALAASHGRDFGAIADSLPAGTRMYVPEVCAVVAVRTGVPPEGLPAPR